MSSPKRAQSRRPPGRQVSGVQDARRGDAASHDAASHDGDDVIAVSDGMRQALALAERVARSPRASALIVGETGVGKEVVASRIHQASARKDAPFVRVNVAALPATMVEAELFGSVEGAYTDSRSDRAGLFASADGGTMLLDEIAELRPELQPKLLRVLENGTYRPIGADREERVDIRFIAATNRDPQASIDEGRLRADLYFRLSTVTIHVPPLRKRDEDLIGLAELFLARFGEEMGRANLSLGPDAVMALYSNDWPGNVRELRNVIERAVIVSDDDVISAHDFTATSPPARFQSTVPPPDDAAVTLEEARQSALERVEQRQIRIALAATAGNKTEAANLLGISRTTLWEKLKLYGIV
jgi:transcriptional regulator with PAS, ATPase and Fis domain